MFFAGFDLLFSILFPILFLVVLGMILYAIIGNIRTWNKNNHSPRLTVPAAVVAKRTEVSHHHTDNTMMHTFTTYYVTFLHTPLQFAGGALTSKTLPAHAGKILRVGLVKALCNHGVFLDVIGKFLFGHFLEFIA